MTDETARPDHAPVDTHSRRVGAGTRMTDTNRDAVWHCCLCCFVGSASEVDAHLVTRPRHVLSPLRTETGRIITTQELDRWVEEAERGYDPDRLTPTNAGRHT